MTTKEGTATTGNDNLTLKDEQGKPRQMGFSETEIQAMLDFLHTLTDTALATDERWADPFIR